MNRDDIRDLYLQTLADAAARPVRGEPDAAVHAFFTLNAGYFLGEWLAAGEHSSLMHRLAESMDGLAGLPVPDDAVHAAQLAQHLRELEDAFGPLPWASGLIRRTGMCVPARVEYWDAQVRRAAGLLHLHGDGHALLLTHARRRLWELAHPTPLPGVSVRGHMLARLREAAYRARTGDGHTIQVTEVLLAEASARPWLVDLVLSLPVPCAEAAP
jgi:hypothetical protein